MRLENLRKVSHIDLDYDELCTLRQHFAVERSVQLVAIDSAN